MLGLAVLVVFKAWVLVPPGNAFVLALPLFCSSNRVVRIGVDDVDGLKVGLLRNMDWSCFSLSRFILVLSAEESLDRSKLLISFSCNKKLLQYTLQLTLLHMAIMNSYKLKGATLLISYD